MRGGAVAGGGVCEGQVEVALVRADNTIGDAGAESLAPSLARMTQLKTLFLGGTLRACCASAVVEL